MSTYSRLLDHYVERYNAGDLDAVMELYAENAVQFMPDGTYVGRAAIRERLARELGGLSDLDWKVTSFVEDGDAFADEWTFVARHTGAFELPGGTRLSPTGRRVEIHGMEYVEMRDGKIVVDNLYYDNVAILVQLGLELQSVPAGAV